MTLSMTLNGAAEDEASNIMTILAGKSPGRKFPGRGNLKGKGAFT
jgi:hypothetical protein